MDPEVLIRHGQPNIESHMLESWSNFCGATPVIVVPPVPVAASPVDPRASGVSGARIKIRRSTQENYARSLVTINRSPCHSGEQSNAEVGSGVGEGL